MEAVGSYDELLAKPGVRGTEVWDEAKAGESRAVRTPAKSTSRTSTRSPTTRRSTAAAHDAPRARSDRLLVRLRRDAVCPVGLSARRAASNSHEQFPADFISEAIDQTRGWFYSQLAISTLLVRRRRSSDDDAAHDRPSHACPIPIRSATASSSA